MKHYCKNCPLTYLSHRSQYCSIDNIERIDSYPFECEYPIKRFLGVILFKVKWKYKMFIHKIML